MVYASDMNHAKSIINADGTTVVDFFANWCQPCKQMDPVLKKLDESFGNKISFMKVDVDSIPELANEYSVQSIPTILFIKNGSVVETQVGAVAPKKMEDLINKYI